MFSTSQTTQQSRKLGVIGRSKEDTLGRLLKKSPRLVLPDSIIDRPWRRK
jgi:hypothetical protein